MAEDPPEARERAHVNRAVIAPEQQIITLAEGDVVCVTSRQIYQHSAQSASREGFFINGYAMSGYAFEVHRLEIEPWQLEVKAR